MMRFVLCFLLKGEKVALSRHRRGPFVGLLSGYGGKIEPGETALNSRPFRAAFFALAALFGKWKNLLYAPFVLIAPVV